MESWEVAGYVIAEVQVTNPERYAEYREQVNASIAAYGGRFLVRGGKSEALEGDAPRGRLVIAEFESYEQARAWYDSPENAGPMKLRHQASIGRLLLVEGC
jgi:uncharacterized protein (DUF1330 family)